MSSRPSLRFPLALAAASLGLAAPATAQIVFPEPGGLRVRPGASLPTGISSPQVALPSDESLRRREIPAAVRAAVEALGSDRWVERERATEALFDRTVALEDLYACLADEELSPERRHRLIAVLSERIVNSPRGALGVRMDTGRLGEAGVRITATIPGMPAEGKLEPDDLVVAIDGRAVRTSNDLVASVQGKAPGDPVRVEALRPRRDERGKIVFAPDGNPDTRRIEVTFPLGSTRELERLGDAGSTLVSTPISAERVELMRAVRARWGPPVRRAALPSEADGEARRAEADAEQHPEIRALRRYREALDAGLAEFDDEAAAVLQETLRRLEALARDASRTPAEREWYGRLARRFAELMPPTE